MVQNLEEIIQKLVKLTRVFFKILKNNPKKRILKQLFKGVMQNSQN